MSEHQVSVERHIAAPAATIFALLSDAGKHPSVDGSETVIGVVDQPQSLALGSKFTMSMRGRKETLFLPYRTTSTVVEFEQDRRIAWQTFGLGGLIGGRIWRYELIPDQTGTLVRETWDTAAEKRRSMVVRGSMTQLTEDGMRATLERIAAVAEA